MGPQCKQAGAGVGIESGSKDHRPFESLGRMIGANVNGIDFRIDGPLVECFVASVIVGEILKPSKEPVESDGRACGVSGRLKFVDEFAQAGQVGETLFGALLGRPPSRNRVIAYDPVMKRGLEKTNLY